MNNLQTKHYLAGVDEVGRGPLVGNVVAAAVILPERCDLPLMDSKRFNLLFYSATKIDCSSKKPLLMPFSGLLIHKKALLFTKCTLFTL